MKNFDFFVFGDSFAQPNINESDWFSILLNNFKLDKYFNNYCPARDTQTIMDAFYSNLHLIKDGSLVVIWLPSLARLRYPKGEQFFDKFCDASYLTNDDTFVKSSEYYPINFNADEFFVYWPYENYPNGDGRKELDFPFNSLNFESLNSNEYVRYNYLTEDGKELIKDTLKLGITPVDFAKLLSANKATSKNWTNIFKSLKKFCKFEIIFVSWTDEYDSDIVFGKKQITKEIGVWHTEHDDFVESNGTSGIEWDEHFSKKMNKLFAEWVIKKYPKYFNI